MIYSPAIHFSTKVADQWYFGGEFTDRLNIYIYTNNGSNSDHRNEGHEVKTIRSEPKRIGWLLRDGCYKHVLWWI